MAADAFSAATSSHNASSPPDSGLLRRANANANANLTSPDGQRPDRDPEVAFANWPSAVSSLSSSLVSPHSEAGVLGQQPRELPEAAVMTTNSARRPNHILLFSIYQPLHPITTDVLRRVCQGLAYVVRAVVIRKRQLNCVRAMVEFSGVAEAMRVRDHLDGVNIYDGCCKMKVDFAFERVYKLKVLR